jgi:hypothetical protein
MMSREYYSDRIGTPRARTEETISKKVWDALAVEVHSRIESGAFGISFPLMCDDAPITIGCNASAFWKVADGHLPDWHQNEGEPPPTLAILDFLEFCYEGVAEPIQIGYHDFFRHCHLRFDREQGREKFLRDVNLILARNGLAFELETTGQIKRIPPAVIRDAVKAAFATGDSELDSLLEQAVAKYMSPNIGVRKESLEKLWDAWERLKTLENPSNKRASVETLLNKAIPIAQLREVVNADGENLTIVGNDFMIRHTEVGKVPIERSEDIDYLFHRLFALVRLLLRATGRGG